MKTITRLIFAVLLLGNIYAASYPPRLPINWIAIGFISAIWMVLEIKPRE